MTTTRETVLAALHARLQTLAARVLRDEVLPEALLHKSGVRQTSPFPGQTHPAASVKGIPSAVKPFRTATRT